MLKEDNKKMASVCYTNSHFPPFTSQYAKRHCHLHRVLDKQNYYANCLIVWQNKYTIP